ncbi:MAG: hypothetical protein ACREA9_21560, partial [Pyrinomonadaceae bacterium]
LYCTKPYSLFSIAARLVRWQQASRTFVVFPKRDARELYIIPLVLDNNTLAVLSYLPLAG